MAAAAGRDQDCGRMAALLFGDGCTGAYAYAYGNWRKGRSMTIVVRVQERQGETNMNLACVIFFTLLGAHVMFSWRWLVGQKLDAARADAASEP